MSARCPPLDAPPRRKTVLFCPECRHESPVDGDWVVSDHQDGAVYACPACGAVVIRRPEYRAVQ